MRLPRFVTILLMLGGFSVTAAFADGAFLWDQSDWSGVDSISSSTYLGAADFTIAETTRLESVTVWISDQVINDNGTIDSFSGILSWAIFDDTPGEPGSLLASGTDTSPLVVDAGFQNLTFLVDVGRATIGFEPPVVLSPGTYWLSIHEGAWGTAGDGTEIYWDSATTKVGHGVAFSQDPTNPTTWILGADDFTVVLYGGAVAIDQSNFVTGINYSLSTQKEAVDFSLPAPRTLRSVEVWLADGAINDNAQLDNFSGSLGWAIYSDNAGAPGTVLYSGADGSVAVVDTGFQDVFGEDLARARFELVPAVELSAGTYWFAMHEGATWGAASDGSEIWWEANSSVVGSGLAIAGDPTTAGGWNLRPDLEATLRLFDDAVFSSGFESGATCAWASASGSTSCP